ncbi:MAG: hypothetical protein ACRC5T_02440 [Cetobacterium sp.]
MNLAKTIENILTSDFMKETYGEEMVSFNVVQMSTGEWFASINDFNGAGKTINKAVSSLLKDINDYIKKETDYEIEMFESFENNMEVK